MVVATPCLNQRVVVAVAAVVVAVVVLVLVERAAVL